MNKLICFLLCFCFLLTGCSVSGERIKEPVKFYYVRENYQKDMEPVIASEVRRHPVTARICLIFSRYIPWGLLRKI